MMKNILCGVLAVTLLVGLCYMGAVGDDPRMAEPTSGWVAVK